MRKKNRRTPVKVSVIMTTLNSGRFVQEAIESIIRQTIPQWELIVVDGGSTDETLRLVRAFKDRRITVIARKGVRRSQQLNMALAHARGQYHAVMDSDDVSFEERLEIQTKYLDDNPSVSIVGSWGIEMDEFGRTLRVMKVPIQDKKIRMNLLTQEDVLFGSACWRNELIQNRLFNTLLTQFEDYDWYAKIADAARFANIPEPLLRVRVTPNSRSRVLNPLNQPILISSIESSLGNMSSLPHAARLRGIANYYYGDLMKARESLILAFHLGQRDIVCLRYLLPALLPQKLLRSLRKRSSMLRFAGTFRKIVRDGSGT